MGATGKLRERFSAAARCRHAVLGLLIAGSVTIVGCVAEPARPVAVRPEPPPDTNVYFYPAQGHPAPSTQQQDRDKYECHVWAVRQTGFDPSLANVPPHQRVHLVAEAPPPGSGVAVGAVTGALLGAAVSGPWHSGSGALIGAVAGAAIGGAAEAESTTEVQRMGAQTMTEGARAALERGAMNYRRALSACLEGRGYSVQ
jgi:hypothetical protein